VTAEAPGGLPPKDARQWALESLDEIAAHPLRPRDCSLDELAAVRRAIDETFTQAQALVDQRRAQGFVRECHGDLHLGNLVRWQGEVFAFDAIEFDARLRCIDVVSDVAFTFMDLHAVGLRPLAWRFINAWAGHTGDYGGLVLLHRFAAYRALVRAKVVLLSGGDAGGLHGVLAPGGRTGARAAAAAAGDHDGAQRIRQVHGGVRVGRRTGRHLAALGCGAQTPARPAAPRTPPGGVRPVRGGRHAAHLCAPGRTGADPAGRGPLRGGRCRLPAPRRARGHARSWRRAWA
jgi:hypothetical protein